MGQNKPPKWAKPTCQKQLFRATTFGAKSGCRCRLFSISYNSLSPFHGGNTGSNPVGDAKFKGYSDFGHDRVTIEDGFSKGPTQQSNDAVIARFFGYMRAERGGSENTAYNYGLELKRLSEWFGKPLTLVQREDLGRYLVSRLDSGLKARSVQRSLRCFRSFFHFLLDDDELQHDPTIGVPMPQAHKPLPKIARHSDVNKMVASLGDSHLDVRNRAILLMFFGSGLRESELAALKLKDIDLETRIVKVWKGKGGKDAVLPLSDSAIEALRRYLHEARPALTQFGKHSTAYQQDSPYLFLGQRCGNRLTRQQVFYCVRDIARAALGRSVSPHQLRHGFATSLLENGADILDVQTLMRHARIDTTQIYLHLDLNYLKEKYDASHPRARLANQDPGLFDSLPSAEPESTFTPRLPRRPARLCGLHGTNGHLPDQPQEGAQLSNHAA